MERQHWSELSNAISQVDQRFDRHAKDSYSTALIVRVFLWAVIHNAATCWACVPENWDRATRPPKLPKQSTLSRRLRRADFELFMQKLQHHLAGPSDSLHLIKYLDGKALPIPAHSTDRQAQWGRGTGQKSNGYKLHALWSGDVLPQAWRLAPLNISEPEMARRMIRDLTGGGYILADKNYDSNDLFDQAHARQHQLICPRRYGEKCGLGHHHHSPQRLRCMDLLEGHTARLTRFGRHLWRQRRRIEREFAQLVSFTGGLQSLPPWVRGYRRVRFWVWAKLLVNAARARSVRARQQPTAA